MVTHPDLSPNVFRIREKSKETGSTMTVMDELTMSTAGISLPTTPGFSMGRGMITEVMSLERSVPSEAMDRESQVSAGR